MDEKNATPGKEAALKALRDEFKGNAADTQRQRLAAALHRLTTITTIEARRYLDILHPAGRAMELRAAGLDIVTLRQKQDTEAGVPHWVGLYVLRRGADAGSTP